MSRNMRDNIHNAILGELERFASLTDEHLLKLADEMTDAAMDAIPWQTMAVMVDDA